MDINIQIINNGKISNDIVSSTLIDTLFNMVAETYNCARVINLQNPTFAKEEQLSDFLTYILAYPKGVDTPRINVVPNTIKHPDIRKSRYLDSGHVIVCFSGGIDSTGALLKVKEESEEPIAFWCDYGQPYNRTEKKTVEKICGKLGVKLIEATVDLSEYIIRGGERFGHVFPARNLLIAAIALCFDPSEIVLAGLCDELVVPDKSLRMYSEFGPLFGVKLYSPFVNMTKTDVLCMWKSRWDTYLDARETESCYSEDGNCQNCSSCAKREIALVGSGYSDLYPIVFSNQHELIENHWFSRIDSLPYKRRTDIMIALDVYKDRITPKLQELLKVNMKKYADEIRQRRIELSSWNK